MNKFLIRPELSVLAFLLAVGFVAVYFGYGVVPSLPLLLSVLALVIVFRNPPRHTPPNALAIVAPIDAVVERIFEVESNELQQTMLLIRLRRRHLGIMALYSPIQGQLHQSWYGDKYVRHDAKDCKDLGHVYTAQLKNNESDSVVLSFFRAKSPRYLQINPQPGERTGQGRAMGLSSIRYVDILVPCNSKLKIEEGDMVKAGESTMALLNHKKKGKK